MKKNHIKTVTGKIKVLTGLHIGAGNDMVEIGGIDNPIIKHPVTGYPYIPGSSIKGKMRSLMEWYCNIPVNTEGAPCSCGLPECKVCRVFGCAIKSSKDSLDNSKKRGPTRLIVRDAFLSMNKDDESIADDFIEEKSENTINRLSAEANPRQLERIVPDTLFDFSLSYRCYDIDGDIKTDEDNFSDVVLMSLKLLTKDYLGGGGSRGNGRIKFENLEDENGNKITLPEV
jgi:CRISPR-associated protein Csm3